MSDPLAFLSPNDNIKDSDNNHGFSVLYGSDPFNNDYFVKSLKNYWHLLFGCYKKVKNYDIENQINGMRTLTLRSSLYRWILKKFGSNSMVTRLCFHDIILSKVWIGVEKQHHPERDITTMVRDCAIDDINLIYKDFCKNHVAFENFHMNLLKKVRISIQI